MLSELTSAFRILTFRASGEELHSLNHRHLALGLFFTWIVGMGRWWEDPQAGLLQHLGIGSLIYVFALSAFLWLILWPLNPPHWSFINLLAFVSLTSPPGILYALPVRHGLELHTAQTVRLWLLAIVAGWRVLLLGYYLGRGAGFSGSRRFLATLFPLVLIVSGLTALNLEKVVFRFMSAIGETDRSVNDAAYSVLFMLALLSVYLSMPLFLFYAVASVRALIARFARPKRADTET